jgi:hypothetical protein
MNAETNPLDAAAPRDGAAAGGAADWIPVMTEYSRPQAMGHYPG